MILIVGGTGSLAGAAAERLLARGHTLRVMTRTPEKLVQLEAQGVEVVPGDLLDKASLESGCQGVQKVLTAAHSIFGRGREESKNVDLQGHMDLIDAAKAQGIEHFVYTSVFDFGPQFNANTFFQIHRQVEQYLQESELDYTILQPTAFMESHAELFIGKPILESGKVTLFGKGNNPRNFVAADDVAQFAVMALEDDQFKGRILPIGGPENLTNMDVVRLYEQQAGQPAKVRHIPLVMLRVMGPLLRPFHPGLSQIMHSAILNDTADCTFDATALLEEFPIVLARLADWIEQRNRSKLQFADL